MKVFISYKSEYRDFARTVQSQLRQWGYSTWFDMDDIPKGAYFRHEIQKGLDGSDVLVGVMTQEAFDSREVMAEWDYFLAQDKELLPLKYRECKPLYHLVTIQWIDFVKDEARGFTELKDRLGQLAQVAPGEPILDSEIDADEKPVALEPADKLDDLILEKPKPGAVIPPPAPITSPSSMPAPAAPPAQTYDRKREQQAADGLTLLTSPARKSRAAWLRPALAVASLAIVVGIVALITSRNIEITYSPPNAIDAPPGISPLIPLAGLLIIAAAVYVARARGVTLFGAGEDAQATQQLNRQRMLDKVEEFWIRGVLDKALEAGRLELGLSAAPGMVLRHKDYGDYALPKEASILDVFNDLNRELLILGAPGAGKTVLMLQLAQKLIEQARNPTQSPPRIQGGEANPTAKTDIVGTPFLASASPPIPVVFNLSSWAAERKPLADWLADELRLKYQVPKKVAKEWVEGEQLLPLLDGLDEVNEQYRNDCVEAINTFRQQYRSVDLVVCSRVADYELLTKQLDLRGAVALEPLSQSQIERYLNRPELNGLREVMREDASLREMAETPFLLNAMAYAYAGATTTSLQEPKNDDTTKARRTHLFDRLVEKRLGSGNSTDRPYTAKQTRHYLSWLARKLSVFKQTVFYIEGLQPTWLDDKRRLRLYRLIQILSFGPTPKFRKIQLTRTLVWQLSWRRLSFGLVYFIAIGLVAGLTNGLIVGLIIGLLLGFRDDTSPTNRSVSHREFQLDPGDIRLAENLSWHWTRTGLTRGILIGLLGGLTFGLSSRTALGLTFGLLGGLGVGVPYTLVTSLRFNENIDSRIVPNQGIYLSARNALRIGLPVGLIFGLAYGLLVGQVLSATYGLVYGLVFAMLSGTAVGLAYSGGNAVIRHLTLRLILWRAGDAPLNYARFLDYCASAGLLRKVGGGYIFAHRYLLEYFAEQ